MRARHSFLLSASPLPGLSAFAFTFFPTGTEKDPFGTSLGPGWDPIGTSSGPIWDLFGTPLGPRSLSLTYGLHPCNSRCRNDLKNRHGHSDIEKCVFIASPTSPAERSTRRHRRTPRRG